MASRKRTVTYEPAAFEHVDREIGAHSWVGQPVHGVRQDGEPAAKGNSA